MPDINPCTGKHSGQTPLSPCLRGVYIPIERKNKESK